ncbi:crossover junction endodeoxyribonuclease RuvC [Streptomyces nigra]|uniref:crossover junction endodeoxyribonuclease RuvC n=1 Tax=Streptomyces nigra TaxID=1827580 RepID=UPI0036A8E09C
MTRVPGLLEPGRPRVDPAVLEGMLRVIGFDLSIVSTGYGLPDGSTGRIKTRQRDGDRRLLVIEDTVAELVAEHRPDVAVLEDMPTRMRPNAVKALGKVHGVVNAALLRAGVPYVYLSPATLKSYAADNGNASKDDMAAAAFLAAGVEFPDDPKGDRCDGWWLRAAGHDAYGAPLFELPKAQRERLAVVSWPNLMPQRFVLGMAP